MRIRTIRVAASDYQKANLFLYILDREPRPFLHHVKAVVLLARYYYVPPCEQGPASKIGKPNLNSRSNLLAKMIVSMPFSQGSRAPFHRTRKLSCLGQHTRNRTQHKPNPATKQVSPSNTPNLSRPLEKAFLVLNFPTTPRSSLGKRSRRPTVRG